MSGSSVELSNGTTLPSDAAVFSTGWEVNTSMFSPPLALELGLPTSLDHQESSTAKYWDDLNTQAEKDLLHAYPILHTAPEYHKKPLTVTPFRLYRHIVPPSLVTHDDHSLVFLGLLTNLSFAIYSEVAALWAVSWMEGMLDSKTLPASKAELDYGIAKFNTWSAMRYVARGRTRMMAGGEIQDIIDLLMRDLGLEIHRGRSWVRDAFLPYRAQDYKGIVQDVLERNRGVKR